MTKADQIRSMMEMDTHAIAAAVGVSKAYVYHIRWMARYPERSRATKAQNARVNYHRSKVLGGFGHKPWRVEDVALLKKHLRSGKSFLTISKEMGISKSAVAGRVKRLRDAGELA